MKQNKKNYSKNEIKNRFNKWIVYCHLVSNHLSSFLLPNNMKTEM